jgi:hypothetical protein
VFIGVGPAWWGPRWYPYYYPYPYYGAYYPYYYPYYPSPVVVREPAVYVQQPAPAEPAPAPEPSAYWYYCQSAQAYYPNVPSCPEAWIKVAPRNP